MLEPRRLAARLAAARVAEELGEPRGRAVGYQVRFEDVARPRTRIRFVTEGVLTRRLLSDPELRGVGAVVLDEFHERHLPSRPGAWRCSAALQRGPPARTCGSVVMSATLDAGPGGARSSADAPRAARPRGARFEVAIESPARPRRTATSTPQVPPAVRRLVAAGDSTGDVLVFLPGAARSAARGGVRRVSPSATASLVLPLHGDLPPAEQDRAVRPVRRRAR